MAAPKKSLKGYYLTTFLIGLGFFTVGLMDPLYDTFVPVFLLRYIQSHALVGAIMTLDNVLAVFLIPFFSSLSDRLHTPIGRRMPFIVICLPVTALAFGLIPYAALAHLYALVALLFLLHLLQLLIQLSRLFQFDCQIPAAELEAPVEADGKRAEGNDEEGFDEVGKGEQVASYLVAHGKLAIETDGQCH